MNKGKKTGIATPIIADLPRVPTSIHRDVEFMKFVENCATPEKLREFKTQKDFAPFRIIRRLLDGLEEEAGILANFPTNRWHQSKRRCSRRLACTLLNGIKKWRYGSGEHVPSVVRYEN